MAEKIAITGTGGGVGQSIMKSLQNTGYEIVALDGEILGTGLYAASRSYLIPYADAPEYIPTLIDICRNEKISLLFPGLDAELVPLSKNRHTFTSVGTTVIVSSPEVIEISDNKQLLYDRLKDIGISIPFTVPFSDISGNDLKFPIIIKQMTGGARSKNVFRANNKTEWNAIVNKIGEHAGNFIVQEYIEGDEYTCGTVNLNESCMGIIVMRRILRDGDTYKCFTEPNQVIEDTIRKLVTLIKPFGACNIQLRLKNGQPYIFEINARCSGTTAARTLCGFNEPKMIADYLLKGIKPSYHIRYQTVLRYWNELVVENESVRELQRSKKLNQSKFNSL